MFFLPAKYGVIFLVIFSPIFYFMWTSTMKVMSYENSGYGSIIVASILTLFYVALLIFLIVCAIEEKDEDDDDYFDKFDKWGNVK